MINVIFRDLDCEIMPKRLETYYRYCQILRWGRRNPTKFLETFMFLEFTDHQKWILLNSWCKTVSVILASRSSGKALALDTPIYVLRRNPSSKNVKGEKFREPKTIGDLQVGDIIYDADGLPTKVVHLNPIVFDEVYEVEFEDGEIIECNADHLWQVWDAGFDRYNKYEDKWVIRSTDFIYNNLVRNKTKGVDYRFRVPLNKPIAYPKMLYVPIDPYILGAWLGDGSSNAPTITTGIQDLNEMVELLSENSLTIKIEEEWNKPDCFRIHVDRLKELEEKMPKRKAQLKSLLQKLRNLNLYKNKHIPEKYKYGSIEQRIALLQGLMDTDGTIDEQGHCEFTQTNKRLAEDVCELLVSLGIQPTLSHKTKTNYIKKDGIEADTWRVYFVPHKEFDVFRLKRKKDRQRKEDIRDSKWKTIVDVRKSGIKKPMRCITVNNHNGLFLCGKNMTVTHNSYMTSPLIMAYSLLFPNHHTYIMAPSGNQAQETFTKMEDLAKGNIGSALGVSPFFLMECVKQNSKADPFTHDKNSYEVKLFNGSSVNTLNSVAKTIVGIRFFI